MTRGLLTLQWTHKRPQKETLFHEVARRIKEHTGVSKGDVLIVCSRHTAAINAAMQLSVIILYTVHLRRNNG